MNNSIKTIKKIKSGESGQAFAELCVGLIPLLCVMLFMIYFSGISISSIEILLDARSNAAERAANPRAGGGYGSMIRSWSYGHDQEDENVAMAYFQDDKASGSTAIQSNTFLDQFDSGDFKVSSNPASSAFYPSSRFNQVDDQIFLDAADMVCGEADDNQYEPVATMDVNNSNGLLTVDQKEKMDKTFDFLLPGDSLINRLLKDEMPSWQVNKVYMPVQRISN